MKIKTSVAVRLVRLLELIIYTRQFYAILVAALKKYLLSACHLLGIGRTWQY